ncbi:MAG: hypothetical protein Q9192_003715 [Flavoplaca navasiana]
MLKNPDYHPDPLLSRPSPSQTQFFPILSIIRPSPIPYPIFPAQAQKDIQLIIQLKAKMCCDLKLFYSPSRFPPHLLSIHNYRRNVAKVLATAPSRPQLRRHGRTLALALAQRRPLRFVVVGREEVGVVVRRDEVVEGEGAEGRIGGRVEDEGKEEEANVVPLGETSVLMMLFVGTDVDALVLVCNAVDVPLGFELDGEAVDDVVLGGRADDVLGLPPRPRPRLRHRSLVHPSAVLGFTVVLDGLDMVVGGCVVDEEVVLGLTEEEVDEDKEDATELGGVLNEFVEVLPRLDTPVETEDEVTRLVGMVDELDVVGPASPPGIGKLALTHSTPEHPEPEACTDGDELLVEDVDIVEVVGAAVKLVGLKIEVVGINVEVTVETTLPESVVVSTETLMHVVSVHELALPEPAAIVIDDGNDDGVVPVVDGAFPPPRPSERQRSPLQVDATEGDRTVARVVAT